MDKLVSTIYTTFFTTLEQILLLIVPALALGLALNHVSGRLEVLACQVMGIRAYRFSFGWLGTAVHELSHALMCVIFRHKIDRIQLFNLDPDATKAGYVTHRYNPQSLYQGIGNFFIGIAPLLIGAILIYFSAWLLFPDALNFPKQTENFSTGILIAIWSSALSFFILLLDPENYTSIGFYVFFYVLFFIGSNMKMSKADLNGAGKGFVSFLLAFFLLNLLANLFPSQWSSFFSDYFPSIIEIALFVCSILIFALGTNLILLLGLRIAKKLLRIT